MHDQFTSAVRYFLTWNLERILRCLDELSEEQLWQRPNASSNSVGNQVLHLCGNLRQWVLSGVGGEPDDRRRDAEFAARGGHDRAALGAALRRVIDDCVAVVDRTTEAELRPERPVQAYRHDGVFILLHATEHLSYHTGQIIFQTKALLNVDLDFYGGDDLTATGGN